MKKYLLIAAGLILCLPVHGQERSTVMNDVTIWYDAFNKRDATLAQKVMSEDWIDIPAAPGQPPGRKGVQFILDDLSKAFPDFRITPAEILQDGNKVVVRSELTGTQRAPFMGFPAKNRTMTIQTIDIPRVQRWKDYPHLAQRGLADRAPPTGRVREVAILDRCSGAKTRCTNRTRADECDPRFCPLMTQSGHESVIITTQSERDPPPLTRHDMVTFPLRERGSL